MKTVNIQEAKTHLSRLVAQAAGGETIVIGKAGVPLAVLSKWQSHASLRKGGGWADKIWISEDFDSLDLEIETLFSGTDAISEIPDLRVTEEPSR